MKRQILTILVIVSTIYACTNKAENNSNSIDDSRTEDKLTESIGADEIQINTRIPFGCANLTTKYWEADPENYGRLKQPEKKEYLQIGECFESINNANTLPTKPKIIETRHIKIGIDFKDIIYYDTLAQQNIDSLKYRLPYIGIYECYYFYAQSKNKYGDYGNLLFFDPKLKTG